MAKIGVEWGAKPHTKREQYLLDSTERALLEVLDESGGFTTGQVSRLAKINYSISNRRARSHAIRSWLINLMKDGYVEFLDEQLPVCWKRTIAGTEALKIR